MEPYRDGSPTPRRAHGVLLSISQLFRTRMFRVLGLAIMGFSLLIAVAFYSPVPVEAPEWLLGGKTSNAYDEEVAFSQQPATNSSLPPAEIEHQLDQKCIKYPDPDNIAIALKTGATEAIERIPGVMLTMLRCAKNVMLFSDMEQDVAGFHLHDSLKDINQSYIDENPDFTFYKKLQEYKKYGQIPTMLKNFHNPGNTGDLAAWVLDKYKQLHILEHLYKEHPDKDWYFMFDADTYLIWSNLLQWLPKLPDPRKHQQYFGSIAMVGDIPFAHGGSGIMISQAAMHELFVKRGHKASDWDHRMQKECCGDFVIALALKDIGIPVKSAWPTISGDTVLKGEFSRYWCEPVVTLHHMSPNEMNEVTNLEMARLEAGDHEPLLWADLYNYFLRDVIPDEMDDWDNVGYEEDIETKSFADCKAECEKDKACFQWNFNGKICKKGHSFHLGVSKPKDGQWSMKSGWLRDRIDQWIKDHTPCKVKFPTPS